MSSLEDYQKAIFSDTSLSTETLIKHLLDGNEKEFKTEITNPAIMSTLDVVASYVLTEFFGEKPKMLIDGQLKDVDFEDSLNLYLDRLRTNMISYNRKSRIEAVDVLKAKVQEGVQKVEDMLSRLTRR